MDIVQPAACNTCADLLVNYFKFSSTCASVEEKINKYCEQQGTNSNGLINFNKVVKFSCEDALRCAIAFEKIIIKQNVSNDDDSDFQEIGIEEHDLKEKVAVGLPNKCEHAPEMTMYNCCECEFKTKYLRSLKKHSLVHKDASEVTMYKCCQCEFETKHLKSLKKHSLVHKDTSEVTIYKCSNCKFKTKHKAYLKTHTLVHKDSSEVTMYKCCKCDYKTKYQANLKIHNIVHKNASEVTFYKCFKCEYKTKYKFRLNRHSLVHKDASEMTMYECDKCTFKTKYQKDLTRHDLVHKDASEVTMYKCGKCMFKTKYQTDLTRHGLVHKDASEVTMYKCSKCEYKTKNQKYLKTHSLVHKDASEWKKKINKYCEQEGTNSKGFVNLKDVVEFSCEEALYQETIIKETLSNEDDTDSEIGIEIEEHDVKNKIIRCDFKTKSQSNLDRHSLVHKNASEVTSNFNLKQTNVEKHDPKDKVTVDLPNKHEHSLEVAMHQCEKCKFKTRHKSSLIRHFLVHNHNVDIETYKCETCGFTTKCKEIFKSCGSDLIKCHFCDFETKHNNFIEAHLENHRDTSGLYKCGRCDFKTNYQSHLNRHSLVHKNDSDVTMYKCCKCEFKTKYQYALTRHGLVHKDASEEISIAQPVVCINCVEQSMTYLKFVSTCASVEEKISQYCKQKGGSSDGFVNINDVVYFSCGEAVITSKEVIIKQTLSKDNPGFKATDIKIEEHEIKRSKRKAILKRHRLVHSSEMSKCNIQRFEAGQDDFKKADLQKDKQTLNVKMYQCGRCDYKTKYQSSLKQHGLVHKDASELTMYKCCKCEFKTKHQSYPQDTHFNSQGCFRDASEVTMYECGRCEYKSKSQEYFKRHSLVHKNASEVKMYKCCDCEYETKYQSTLKQHGLLHKDASEVTMYECDKCKYKCKRKGDLKSHFRTHKLRKRQMKSRVDKGVK
ncbi:hypothetical protein NQ317_011672 [Molorchus minor]|uniref:Protein hunchback n=1 Tax=Molorchus minor TaxID=1323400 RepID=A0ABQ9JG44_9CUCU|nr:hypothetical protein NQ317_011672 [Molorchus minor]